MADYLQAMDLSSDAHKVRVLQRFCARTGESRRDVY
jgi:hypothetical protein